MRHKISLAIVSVCMLALAGCIKNNIPYPHIQANFTEFAVEGQSRDCAIDSINRTVTVYLPEEVNIADVHVASYAVTHGAEVVSPALNEPLNLTEPIQAILSLYQEYTWKISAVQNIERYFEVQNQVGESVIDVPARRVVAYIPENIPLTDVVVTAIKLGPDGSTMVPDLNGKTVDFTQPVSVTVTAYGEPQRWTLYMQHTEVTVTTERADAWTNVAWVYATSKAGAEQAMEYRVKGDDTWTTVPNSWIYSNGGAYYARLIHLQGATTYEVRALSDCQYGTTLEFTTGYAIQPPNASFSDWWLDGKVWCPWAEGSDPWWGTGNKGATTLGPSNTQPTDYTSSGTGKAAMLETKFVGIGALGKIAAGNIFAGSYVRTDGTNGVLSFGRPFTNRPTKLRGYYQYTSTPISHVSSDFPNLKGQPDTCIVWVALIDGNEPCEIRTNPKDRKLFNRTDANVIAYGCFETAQTTTAYGPFEFELEYVATDRVPSYILITGAASKYGDYFTGGNGSTLWLDDLELLYDY